MQLTKGEELAKICDGLGYQEYRQVVIKADVIRVEFVTALQDIDSDSNNSEVGIGACSLVCVCVYVSFNNS